MRGLRAATYYSLPSAKSSSFTSKTSLVLLQPRYASSGSAPALKPSSPPSRPPAASINGPLTTLPPPLDLPTRAEDQSLPSYLLATGKSYVKFYKTGIKNIYANYQLSRTVQSRLSTSKTTLVAAVQNGIITRSDFQLLYRNRHDIRRVPIFALVLLVCGEFTPLVVIAFTAVVPWTCRIPKQIDSDRRKLEKRREESFRDLISLPPTSSGVEKLDKWKLRHINTSLGLSSKLWEWVFGPPEMLLKRKVGKQLEYLEMDDLLIRREGGVGGMSEEEVRMACVERGINVMGPSEESLKRTLDNWLRSREKVGIEKLLLTRRVKCTFRTLTDC